MLKRALIIIFAALLFAFSGCGQSARDRAGQQDTPNYESHRDNNIEYNQWGINTANMMEAAEAGVNFKDGSINVLM